MEWLFVLIGFIMGSIVVRIIFSSSGTLKIDRSNPEKDIYRLDINDLDNISTKRYVVLKVDNHADLSHQ